MNPDNSPRKSFEQGLADFAPTPLPDTWKDELIKNAVSAPAANTSEVAFSWFRKVSLSGIAAAWVAIAILRLTTPADQSDSQPGISPAQAQIPSPEVPLLVRYIEQRRTLAHQF